MTFRERMRVNPSAAEEKVAVALQDRGVKSWFKDSELVLTSTVPDFWFPTQGVAVYLDGEAVHSGAKAIERDDRISDVLTKRGLKVLRFRYRPPLSKRRLDEIVEAIGEALK